jgi:hypothetical protein
VYRHKTEHFPAHLLKARSVEEVAQVDDLLEQVRPLQTHALHIPERARRPSLRDTLIAFLDTVPCSVRSIVSGLRRIKPITRRPAPYLPFSMGWNVYSHPVILPCQSAAGCVRSPTWRARWKLAPRPARPRASTLLPLGEFGTDRFALGTRTSRAEAAPR